MPRLPDKSALGGMPSLDSGRQYPSAGEAKADVSGEQATSIALAKGFEAMAGAVGQFAEEEIKQQDALDLIRANAQHAERLRDIQNDFDTDNDHQTFRPRFADRATQSAADAAAVIRNPRMRARWAEQAQERNSAAMDRVLDRGTRLQREEKEIDVTKALETYRNLYATAPDDATRQRILADIDVTVMAGHRTGLLDRSRAEALRSKAINDALRDDIERRMTGGEAVAVMRELGALPDPSGRRVRPFRPEIQSAIDNAADTHGVDRTLLATIARIESGGDPTVSTGSYGGLFQISEAEFRRRGGTGSRFDPVANADAAALKLKAEMATFERKYGRPPSAAEIYLIHQQGEGGADAHWRNPDQPAWRSMLSTAEGRQKGERWAKQAIWGNVPDDVKERYGSVENMTSRDFTQMWEEKVARIGGDPGATGRYARLGFAERRAIITRSKIAMSAETQHDLRDSYQTILDTGEEPRSPDGTTALERARMFLQPNQVRRAEMQIEEARLMHRAISPLRGMNEREVVDHLNALRDPGATGERAATVRKVSQAAEKAWEEIQNERNNDPAEAVDPYTNVRTQRAGRTRRSDEVTATYDMIRRRHPNVTVRETASGAFEIMDPEQPTAEALAETHRARRALIDARIEAQAKLGIPRDRRSPISRREAEMILDMPENVTTLTPAEYRTRLRAAADRAELMYGKDMASIVLEAAMKTRRMGDGEFKQAAEGMYTRLARGVPPTSSEVRRLRELQDLERRSTPFDRPLLEEGRRPRSDLPPLMPPTVAPPTAPTRPTGRAALPAPTTAPAESPTQGARPEPRKTQRGYFQRQQQRNPFDELDQ